MKFKSLVCLVLILAAVSMAGAEIANFDDLSLADDSHWSGTYPYTGGDTSETITFTSGDANFVNTSGYSWGYPFWGGFAYSNVKDPCNQSWTAQFNSVTGDAQSGDNYAIGYVDTFNSNIPTMILDAEQMLGGLYVTNTSYTYYSMLNGDSFAKKFGGADGNDADWFVLTITGKNANGEITGTVDFYLADYRFEDNSLDYITNTWEYVDLTSLGNIKTVEFSLDSSDTSYGYINTPLYFAIDTVLSPLGQIERDIEYAITEKIGAVEAIEEALTKEEAAIKTLKLLLADGNLTKSEARDIQRAKIRTRLAMVREMISKKTLNQSVDDLENALNALAEPTEEQ